MEIVEKVFTKNRGKDIISKNYNPLRVNYNLIYEREGLFMDNNIVLEEVKELSKKYNKKENLFLKMFDEGIKKGFNINEIRKTIDEFEKSNSCY